MSIEQTVENAVASLKMEFFNDGTLQNEFFTAADVDFDGKLSITDYLRIKCHIQGKYDIYA